MAPRPLWLFRHDPGTGTGTVTVVFCRRYPTIEIRAETFNGSTHRFPFHRFWDVTQLTEEGSQLKITVNVKLHESIRNSFEYCEAHIPFFNRGPMAQLEYKVSYGQVDLSREKSLLVWVIGKEHPTDYICTGSTAYVKLYFRISEFTLTGCYVDQHSIQIFAPGKPKITASQELISSDYYIWNSKAPAPMVYKTLLD